MPQCLVDIGLVPPELYQFGMFIDPSHQYDPFLSKTWDLSDNTFILVYSTREIQSFIIKEIQFWILLVCFVSVTLSFLSVSRLWISLVFLHCDTRLRKIWPLPDIIYSPPPLPPIHHSSSYFQTCWFAPVWPVNEITSRRFVPWPGIFYELWTRGGSMWSFAWLGYSWGERQDLEMSPDVIGYPINGPCPQQTSYNCNLNIWTGGLREHVYVSVCKLHFFDEKFLTQPHDLIRALRILGKAQQKTFVSKGDFKLMDY